MLPNELKIAFHRPAPVCGWLPLSDFPTLRPHKTHVKPTLWKSCGILFWYHHQMKNEPKERLHIILTPTDHKVIDALRAEMQDRTRLSVTKSNAILAAVWAEAKRRKVTV